MGFGGAVVAFVLLTGLGLAVVRGVESLAERARSGGPETKAVEIPGRPVLETLSQGFLGGIAVVGILGQAVIWLGGRLTVLFWVGIGIVAVLGALATAIGDGRALRSRWDRWLVAPAGFFPGSPVGWALLVLVLLAIGWSFLQALTLPVLGWDPLSFWYLKTKILYHVGTTETADFLAANRVHAHTDYPILVNVVEAGICHAVGEYREGPLKVFLALWQAACLAVVWGPVRRRRGSTVAWIGVALVALLPALTDFDTTGAVSGYRDPPLALAVLAAGCVAWEWRASKSRLGRPACVLILLLVLVIGTKREGSVWAVMIGGLTAFSILAEAGPAGGRSFRRVAVTLGLLVGLPLVLMSPWFAVRASLPHPRSEDFLKIMGEQSWEITGERATVVLQEFRNELFLRIQKWGVLWWVFAWVGLWRRFRWEAVERYLALAVPGGWLMAAVGFVFTPWGDSKTHLAVSIDRLVLQGALLALWLLVLNLVPDDEPDLSREENPTG